MFVLFFNRKDCSLCCRRFHFFFFSLWSENSESHAKGCSLLSGVAADILGDGVMCLTYYCILAVSFREANIYIIFLLNRNFLPDMISLHEQRDKLDHIHFCVKIFPYLSFFLYWGNSLLCGKSTVTILFKCFFSQSKPFLMINVGRFHVCNFCCWYAFQVLF